MAKRKAETEEEVTDEELDEALAAPEEAAPAKPEKEDSKTSVTVVFPGGERTYSKDEHGADFKKLAKEFADKKGGKLA
jgi:hypothetical protein